MKEQLKLSVYVNGRRTPVFTKEVTPAKDIPVNHKIAEAILQASLGYQTERVLVKIEKCEERSLA